jgi:NAD(P)-dependent dehydrogenase (short-subunit alcohol dehydrogenase family)
VVNLAGIVRLAAPESMSLDAWREVTAVNLDGAFLVAQAASPMLERGGRLVVFSSMSGAIANKGRENTAYSASKAGVVGLVKSLAALWAPRGVTVNAVSPGYVGTEVTRQRLSPDLIAELEELTPLARMGEPGDMVAPTLFLTSEQAAFVTGHVLVADGGYTVW